MYFVCCPIFLRLWLWCCCHWLCIMSVSNFLWAQVLPIFPRLVDLPLDKFRLALAHILQVQAILWSSCIICHLCKKAFGSLIAFYNNYRWTIWFTTLSKFMYHAHFAVLIIYNEFGVLQGSAHTGPALTPAEVLVAIHDIVPEKEGIALKKVGPPLPINGSGYVW